MSCSIASRRYRCSVLTMALLPMIASAEVESTATDITALDEVVVTATKQSRELSKVPISITALTQETMDERSIKDIGDIVLQTPGLDMGDQGSNGVGTRISIRGIDSNSGFATTGIYIDDTPIQGRANPVNLGGTAFPEVFDLERVEVLRGPQGTLFGAGAEGGVVRFITPTPGLNATDLYARGEFSYTQHGSPSYEGGVALGSPLVEGKSGVRISGWARHEGGWVDRIAWATGDTHQDVNWSDAGGARIALRFKPTESLSITPSLLFQSEHQNDTPNYWTSLSNPSRGQFVNGFQSRQQSTDQLILSDLKIEADLGPVAFTSITSYFYRNESSVTDVTNYDIAGAMGSVGPNGEDNIFPTVASGAVVTDLFLGTTHQNIFTQEFRLQNSDKNAKLKWVGGVYFQNSRLHDTQLAPNPLLPQLFLEQQGPDAFQDYYYTTDCVQDCNGLLNGVYEYTGNEHSRDMQTALFGNVDWLITPRLTLTGGLRVDHTQSTFVAVENGPVNNGASVGGGEISATPVTPKISVSFQQNNDALYYASISKGYRAGGGNSHVPPACGMDLDAIGLSAAPNSYNSDSTISYEVGTKQHFAEGRMNANVSVFYIDWRDIQWYYFLPNCGYGIVFNLGHARSQGFDLEFNAKLTSRLLASVSVGYTDAKFLENATLPVVFSGQTLGQAPWTVFTSLEYRMGAGFYARATDNYKSRNNGKHLYQIPDSAIYDPELQPEEAINQLDIRVGKKWKAADLSIFINNALNAAPVMVNPQASHYVGYDFNSGDAVSSPIFSYSTLRPRTMGVTLTYRY